MTEAWKLDDIFFDRTVKSWRVQIIIRDWNLKQWIKPTATRFENKIYIFSTSSGLCFVINIFDFSSLCCKSWQIWHMEYRSLTSPSPRTEGHCCRDPAPLAGRARSSQTEYISVAFLEGKTWSLQVLACIIIFRASPFLLTRPPTNTELNSIFFDTISDMNFNWIWPVLSIKGKDKNTK